MAGSRKSLIPALFMCFFLIQVMPSRQDDVKGAEDKVQAQWWATSPTSGQGSCGTNEFACWNYGQCIPSYWRCDYYSDCWDGSDEYYCGSYTTPDYNDPATTDYHIGADVVCDSTSMTVILDKSLLHVGDDGRDVHFEDDSCTGYTYDANRVAITTTYHECSTAMEESDDYIVYSNLVTYREQRPENGTNQVITRDHVVSMPITCNMEREKTVGESFVPRTGVITFEEVGYGEFSMSLERYKSSAFSEPANDWQEVGMGAPLYFAVNLTASTDLTVFIDTCWATPYAYPLSSPNYTMIQDGCGEDATVVMYTYLGPKQAGFRIDAFGFIGDYSQVYVHCDVLVCDSNDWASRCAQGCVSRKKRSAQPSGSRSAPHTISVGPLSRSHVQSGYSQDGASPMTIAAIGSLVGFIALLILAVMAMFVRMRRHTRILTTADEPLLANGQPEEY